MLEPSDAADGLDMDASATALALALTGALIFGPITKSNEPHLWLLDRVPSVQVYVCLDSAHITAQVSEEQLEATMPYNNMASLKNPVATAMSVTRIPHATAG